MRSSSKRFLQSLRSHGSVTSTPSTTGNSKLLAGARVEVGSCHKHNFAGSRLFGSSSASSSPPAGPHHKHKKPRRPAATTKRSAYPKRKNHPLRKKQSELSTTRSGASKTRARVASAYSENDSRYGESSGGATSSVASSIVDRWEDDHRTHKHNNNNNSDRIPSRRNFQFDRFQDRQQEYCRIMEDYRNFWYPGNEKSKSVHHPSEGRPTDDWKTAMTFRHPDPNEELPWLNLSWEKLLASEELFRRVCASHHTLFLACASYLSEQTESQKSNNNNHNNNPADRYRRNKMSKSSSKEDTEDWTDEYKLRADYDELLANILPNWEALRRQRAALVHKYRPDETLSECSDEANSFATEEQQVSPWATNDTNAEAEMYQKTATIHDREIDEESYQNNRWVGWLKKMITGDETEGDATAETASIHDATAHLDPECAPNHYHYTKLIGQLYFHYLPHERHIRKNPFHIYSKSEREEGLIGGHEEYDSDREDFDVMDSLHEDTMIGNNSHENDGDGSTPGGPDKISYQTALAAYEHKRRKILEARAERMQHVIDQALLPLGESSRNTTDTTTTQLHEDDSNRVLTDKIVRLLIRSYLDQESLEAAQQAERVYNRHPNHRKHLLWYVAMCYLKVIKSTLKQQRMPGKDKFTRRSNNNDDLATAAKRICELVSSKYAKEAREFQHCSGIAFEALAILPEYSRRELKGYYDRVHSLGILKFGPKVWESLIHGSGKRKSGDGQNGDPSRPSTESTGISKEQSNAPVAVDLSQSLNSKDHKILHHLIQIYSNDEKYFPRALRLLDVMLDLYPPYDLQESLTRSTFHKLLRRLSVQREKAWKKKKASSNLSSLPGTSNNEHVSPELDTALHLLDKMSSYNGWFPNEDTFRIVFAMATYSDNPAPGTEKLRTKLELCRFLASLPNKHCPRFGISSTTTYPFSPLEASKYALDAWVHTASYNNYVVPAGQPHPAEQAWSILQALRMESSQRLLLSSEADGSSDVPATPVNNGLGQEHSHHNCDFQPNDVLYTLALKVCSRVVDSPQSLEVALDIFDAAQTDGLLLEGDVGRVLLGVITNFSNLEPDNIRRIEAAKRVYYAMTELDPNFGENKPNILGFLRKQASYIRIRHPKLYEKHLADLELLTDEATEE